MPLFKKSTPTKKEDEELLTKKKDERVLLFHCLQAHGSPTGTISGFSNIRELYQKIAECFEFPASEVSLLNSFISLIKMNNL